MCRMDYHEPRGVYGDGRTHRKLLAVCQLIFDCNGKHCLSVEKVFFLLFGRSETDRLALGRDVREGHKFISHQ